MLCIDAVCLRLRSLYSTTCMQCSFFLFLLLKYNCCIIHMMLMQTKAVELYSKYFTNHCRKSPINLAFNYTQKVSLCETGGWFKWWFIVISQFEHINVSSAHYRMKNVVFKFYSGCKSRILKKSHHHFYVQYYVRRV